MRKWVIILLVLLLVASNVNTTKIIAAEFSNVSSVNEILGTWYFKFFYDHSFNRDPSEKPNLTNVVLRFEEDGSTKSTYGNYLESPWLWTLEKPQFELKYADKGVILKSTGERVTDDIPYGILEDCFYNGYDCLMYSRNSDALVLCPADEGKIDVHQFADKNSPILTSYDGYFLGLGRLDNFTKVFLCGSDRKLYIGYVEGFPFALTKGYTKNAKRVDGVPASPDMLPLLGGDGWVMASEVKGDAQLNVEIQNAIFPMATLNISQGINDSLSHYDHNYYAIDIIGKDKGKDEFFAPFDAIVVKKDSIPNQKKGVKTNSVFIQSKEKIKFADGSIDYMVIRLAHDNDISNLSINQELKQGEVFYQEGDQGAPGKNHVHMIISKGSILDENNELRTDLRLYYDLAFVHPADALVIDPNYTTNIIDNKGYNWVILSENPLI